MDCTNLLIHAIEDIQDLLLEYKKENSENTHIERALRICEEQIVEYQLKGKLERLNKIVTMFALIMKDEQDTGGKMFDLYNLLEVAEKELK